MSFNVTTTINGWAAFRNFIIHRDDYLGEMKLYEPCSKILDWKAEGSKDGAWVYLKGLNVKDNGYGVHLSCNIVGGMCESFHVTENHSGGIHIATYRVVKCDEEDPVYSFSGYEYKCKNDTSLVTGEGKHSNTKISKREVKAKEKIKELGGKLRSPKTDMTVFINAMIKSGIGWV